MLDILSIVHSFSDNATASRIRCTCRRLSLLQPRYIIYGVLADDGKKDIICTYRYTVGDMLHRLDGPAQESALCKEWYRQGVKRREYHPQYISQTTTIYRSDGKLHREIGPALVHNSSDMCFSIWSSRGNYHRKTAPAVLLSGSTTWATHGEQHRLDGPASGSKNYCIHGKFHRVDAAAKVSNINKWHINNVLIRIDY